MKKISVGKDWNAIECMELALAGLLLLVSFLVFYYTDYSDTLDNTVLLAEAVSKGQFREFYRYSAEHASKYTIYTADYNLFLYLIFLIWNLPTVAAHLLTGFDYMESVKALLWCKALIGLFLLGSAMVLKKIVGLFEQEKRTQNLAVILFLANSCVILPAMVLSQYDIIAVFFMLLGIYYYLKKDEKRFLLFFAVALPLKTFALFVFLPLLLLREKSIWRIAVKTLLIFTISAVCELPFLGEPYYELCMASQNGDALKLILKCGVQVTKHELNLFVICYLALCAFCYLYQSELCTSKGRKGFFCPRIWDKNAAANTEADFYVPLYVCLAAMASLLLFMDIRGYWIILLAPFLVLTAFFNEKQRKANLLLLIGSATAYSVYSMMTFWAYSYGALVTRLFLSRFVAFPGKECLKYGNMAGFIGYYGLGKYANVMYSVFFVGVLLLLLINFPGRGRLQGWKGMKGQQEHEKDAVQEGDRQGIFPQRDMEKEKAVWWPGLLQIAVSGALLSLLLYVNLAENGPYLNRTLDSNTVYGADVLAGNTLSQDFTVSRDEEAELLTFRAYNSNGRRYNRSAVLISLTDQETETVLMERMVGVALIESEKEYDLKFSKVQLRAGHVYTLKIENVSAGMKKESELCFAQTSEFLDEDHPLLVNGEPQKCNLAIRLK